MPPPGWRPPGQNQGGQQAGGGNNNNNQNQNAPPPGNNNNNQNQNPAPAGNNNNAPAGGGAGGGAAAGGGNQQQPPPPQGQSNGSGGPAASGPQRTSGGTAFELVLPSGFQSGTVYGVLIVFSGVEGAQTMAQNLRQSGGMPGHICGVLDGRSARAADGVEVLNQLRAWYNIDNNAVKCLTESAGTREGLTFALRLAQGEIAAVWANDPVAVVTPAADDRQLGFKPYGSAGAGGRASRDVQNAQAIVDGMSNKGYNTRAPFIDPNSGHGTVRGFLEGLRYLADKVRGR